MNIARVYIYKVCLVCALCLCVGVANAQDDVEYRMEIGAGAAMTAYQGDFNGSLVKNMQPGGAVVFRRILSPYMAVKVAAMYTQIKGDYSGAETIYKSIEDAGKYSFKHSLGDLSVAYEYNFLPYGTGRDYRGAQRISPFVSLGLGMTYVNCPNGTVDCSTGTHSATKSVVACNVPLGLGVKCKIGARTNLILDWQMHFTFTDYLDGVKDPYNIASSGMFKNCDSYSTLSLSLTYCFSAKCPTCMKND